MVLNGVISVSCFVRIGKVVSNLTWEFRNVGNYTGRMVVSQECSFFFLFMEGQQAKNGVIILILIEYMWPMWIILLTSNELTGKGN